MTIEDEAKRAAANFRRSFGLGRDAFGGLVALVEDAAAVDVAVLDVGPGIDGMLAYDPKRDVAVVGLAATDVPLRQRSTLAHELAHLIVQDWEVLEGAADCSLGTRTPTEIRADTFARHLLIPADGLREFLAARARTPRCRLTQRGHAHRSVYSPKRLRDNAFPCCRSRPSRGCVVPNRQRQQPN